MAFSPERLLAALKGLPPARCYRVAFSGGLDSSVLLSALAANSKALSVPLTAIHIDHALHPDSADWARIGASLCRRLNIPCDIVRVDARPASGESPEAAAREARYRAFAQRLGPDELLLTAHHRDDQAETILQHFLRGAGPRGLTGMPPVRPLGRGWLARPLLPFSRDELHAWAVEQGLSWIDDPSNADLTFDRNFLRHDLLPRLSAWRRGIAGVLVRNGEVAAEAAELLDELAAEDLARVGAEPRLMPVAGLRRLSPARAHNLLRHWLRLSGLPVPDARRIATVYGEVAAAAEDARPHLCWPGGEVRRYRGLLHAMAPLAALPAGWEGALEPGRPCELPAGLGRLRLVPATGEGLRSDLDFPRLRVALRSGGERCRPPSRDGSHSVKKLFQERGVPPWVRERTPVLFLDGALAAVAGLCIDATFAAAPGEPGLALVWDRHGD